MISEIIHVEKLRSFGFLLVLAIKQNKPEVAIKIISELDLCKKMNFHQNIRLYALAEMDYFKEINKILQYYLQFNKYKTNNRRIFLKEIVTFFYNYIHIDFYLHIFFTFEI